MSLQGERKIRILAADDSSVMRGVLQTLFQLHAADPEPGLPAMELCGQVSDGIEALEAMKRLEPDVLLLDLEMPRLNGLGVLARLREEGSSVPVIMCSAHTERGARSTLAALAQGAQEYVMKPRQQADFASALDSLLKELLPKIAALVRPAGRDAGRAAGRERGSAWPNYFAGGGSAVDAVVVGVSTGGPAALELMLSRLPADFRAPMLIVQHMPKLFTCALAARLNTLCKVEVRQAAEGVRLRRGLVLIAPGDSHMEIGRGIGGDVVRLQDGPALNHCKPSVDCLFHSAARLYGPGVLAVMMTGMGSDGLAGTAAVRAAGGTVFAQDEASSAVWGMPGRVVQAGLSNAVVPLEGLAGMLVQKVMGASLVPASVDWTVAGSGGFYGLL